MVLNHDCFRSLLLYIEEKCVYEDSKFGRRMHDIGIKELYEAPELKSYSNEDKHYTVSKLFEGNYIVGNVIPTDNYEKFTHCFIDGLTLIGHDMADNIHNQTIWNNTKTKLKSAGRVSLSILSQAVGECAAAYSKKMMGLP